MIRAQPAASENVAHGFCYLES